MVTLDTLLCKCLSTEDNEVREEERQDLFGRDERLDRITATILPDNTAMQHVARKTGFEVHHSQGDAEVIAEMRL